MTSIRSHWRRTLDRVFWIAVPFSLATCAPASVAGPHAGGVLLLSACEGELCFAEPRPACASAPSAIDCQTAITETSETEVVLVWVYAVFPEEATVALRGAEFGIEYDEKVTRVLDSQFCSPFVRHTSDWPAPGSGVTMVWHWAETDRSIPLGWFLLELVVPGEPAEFGLRRYSENSARFADETIPPQIDVVSSFGVLGLGGRSGAAPCALPPATGACCVQGTCTLTSEIECEAQAGMFRGDGSLCAPGICTVPILSASWGALKQRFVP